MHHQCHTVNKGTFDFNKNCISCKVVSCRSCNVQLNDQKGELLVKTETETVESGKVNLSIMIRFLDYHFHVKRKK